MSSTEVRFGTHPRDAKQYNTDELRENYLIEKVLVPGEITSVYSMHDRMMTLGIVPTKKSIALPVFEEMTKATYFWRGESWASLM